MTGIEHIHLPYLGKGRVGGALGGMMEGLRVVSIAVEEVTVVLAVAGGDFGTSCHTGIKCNRTS